MFSTARTNQQVQIRTWGPINAAVQSKVPVDTWGISSRVRVLYILFSEVCGLQRFLSSLLLSLVGLILICRVRVKSHFLCHPLLYHPIMFVRFILGHVFGSKGEILDGYWLTNSAGAEGLSRRCRQAVVVQRRAHHRLPIVFRSDQECHSRRCTLVLECKSSSRSSHCSRPVSRSYTFALLLPRCTRWYLPSQLRVPI